MAERKSTLCCRFESALNRKEKIRSIGRWKQSPELRQAHQYDNVYTDEVDGRRHIRGAVQRWNADLELTETWGYSVSKLKKRLDGCNEKGKKCVF